MPMLIAALTNTGKLLSLSPVDIAVLAMYFAMPAKTSTQFSPFSSTSSARCLRMTEGRLFNPNPRRELG
jgi:hypothetical protein